MKRIPLLEIILILWITIFLLVIYSFSGLNLAIGNTEIKRPGIKETLTYQDTSRYCIRTISRRLRNADNFKMVRTDSTEQSILLTGDSMVEGLFFPFREYCKFNHHKFKALPVYSSSTESLAKSDTLDKLIDLYKPTYIILALGSNELFIRDIKKNRDQYVKQILKKIGTIKYVWIGPPNWKKDTGINDMIGDNVPPDQFFISKDLQFDRARDGAHPTRAASRIWADTITKWIMKKSRYPILLNKPPKDFKYKK